MSVAGELSEEADLYSLAQDATYFEIEPEDGRILGEEMVDDMPVFRKSWEKITIKNKPFLYKSSAVSKNKVYDLIIDNPTTTTYFLKLVYGTKTYYGYFGEVDCDINEDRSIITINPAVVDQYTDFIENYEEEIDVFGGRNLIRNGDFEVWTGSDPDFWTEGREYESASLLDERCVKLGSYTYNEPTGYYFNYGRIAQTVSIEKDRTGIFSFSYALVGDTEKRFNLEYMVSLRASVGSTPVYYLNSDGSWGSGGFVAYKTNRLPYPSDYISEFKYFNLVTDKTPIAGILTVELYFREPETRLYATSELSYLYITNVILKSSELSYVDLNIILPSDNIQRKTQVEIMFNDDGISPLVDSNFLYSKIKRAKSEPLYPDLNDFFTDGTPNIDSTLDAGNTRLHDNNDLSYANWDEIFNDSSNQDTYGWQMCELTILQGNYYTQFFKTYRNYYGYASYAREEQRIKDVYDEFDNLVPPEEDSGWVSFDKDPSTDLRLWVRKPFNGVEYTWTLGEKQGSGTDEITGLKYWDKITSVKNYPTSEDSLTVASGIEFRDFCRNIYRSTHASRTDREVYSMFFWNDSPYSDFFDIEDGINYFSMKQNFLNYISVVHTSYIKQISDPSLSASELKMSFIDLFNDLRVKFPSLIWFIDQDYNLHFEHERMLDRIRNYYDISGTSISYIGEYKSYKYDTTKLFGKIVRNDINSYYKDFKESTEKFKKITTNKRRKDNLKELTTTYVSTDITGAIENPDDLGNGIILIAYKINDSGNNVIIYGVGQKTGNNIPNGVLATSYLLKQFGKYVGTWHEGIIDDENIDYHYSTYCRNGNDIKLKGIVSENYLLTDIGIALIKDKTYDYENEETICTPVYRHINFYSVSTNNDFIEMEMEYEDILT